MMEGRSSRTETKEPRSGGRTRTVLVGLILAGLVGCGESTGPGVDTQGTPGKRFPSCELNTEFLWAATSRGAIRDLSEPVWKRANLSVPAYLQPETRVIGVQAFGQSYAIPHNVLWHHEIVNLDLGGAEGEKLAITYCPLTGSSLVFDRKAVGGATLGISGILFKNNLVMFDRNEPDDSEWPQMMAEARCGPRTGQTLPQLPFVEMQWAEWVELHPDTRVLAGPVEQGFDPRFFDYTAMGYPYGTYEEIEPFFIGRIMPPLDGRRFSKERVIGLPSTAGDPGIALPFGALEKKDGRRRVVELIYEGRGAVVLWSDAARGGSAYRPVTADGRPVTLRPSASGFRDAETGSRWTVEGRAVAGPLEGARLDPIETSHTAFWGAWAAFHPETRLWEG